MSTPKDKKRFKTKKRKPSFEIISFATIPKRKNKLSVDQAEISSDNVLNFNGDLDSSNTGVTFEATGDIIRIIEDSQTENDILDRAEADKFKIYICPNLASVYIDDPNILYTNMISSSKSNYATKVRNEIVNIYGFHESVKSASDIPIDFDIDEENEDEGHFLINHLSTPKKKKRYRAILKLHDQMTGVNVDINELEKFQFLDSVTKTRTGHRLLLVRDYVSRTIYIHFLDPHHLFATSFNKYVKTNFPKHSKHELNISDLISD